MMWRSASGRAGQGDGGLGRRKRPCYVIAAPQKLLKQKRIRVVVLCYVMTALSRIR